MGQLYCFNCKPHLNYEMLGRCVAQRDDRSVSASDETLCRIEVGFFPSGTTSLQSIVIRFKQELHLLVY